MTDISDLLKSTMQEENCLSLYAFLVLKGDKDDKQFPDDAKSTGKPIIEWQRQTNG